MKTAFACALVALASQTNALRLQQDGSSIGGCDVIYEGEMRYSQDTLNVYDYIWSEGIKSFRPSPEIVYNNNVMRYCGDNTIRTNDNQCVARIVDGNRSVITQCVSGDSDQQFEFVSHQVCADNIGFEESCVALRNVGSGNCMGSMGENNDAECDDMVMFRSKGKKEYEGRIQNVGTLQCLAPVEIDNEVKVTSVECTDDSKQLFTVYENTEIVHDDSGLCLGQLSTPSSILMILTYCQDQTNQSWDGEEIGDAYYVKQNGSGTYLDSSADGEDITVRAYRGDEYQQWRVIYGEGEWGNPEFSWISVGCDSGVDLTHMYEQKMYLLDSDGVEQPVTDADAESFKDYLPHSTVLDNTPAVQADAISEVYDTAAEMVWHPSDPYVDKQHAFNCGEFEDGTPAVDGGCLWRAKMQTHNWYQNNDLVWHTPFTKCTQSAEPSCPPFTRLSVDGSSCEAAVYVAPQ